MYEGHTNPMNCTEFEALLAEALDGTLGAPEMARFQSHLGTCEQCGPLFALAREGQTMLRGLAELEPPAYLVQKILNVTSEVPARVPQRRRAEAPGWFGTRPFFAAVMHPRFGMSFAMAFFSLMLIFNVTGVNLRDAASIDWRPTAMKTNVVKSYYEATGRVQKYYENLRFVYQVQSTLRDLRNATTSDDQGGKQAQPQQQQPPQQKQQRRDDNTSERPQEKNQRYSLGEPAVQLAAAPQIRFGNDRRTA
jgi:hypothetical protein